MIERKTGKRYVRHGMPYVPLDGLSGTLITIEGTDGVGRSVQIRLLKEWLEVQGYGVIETGWTRSELMSETIGLAKQGNKLNYLTFSLLYATDFADRLEKVIIPALRSGFVVLADRYMYTAFARSVVRGADPRWLRELFGFAMVPDLTIYLKTDLKSLIPRFFVPGETVDFWEAGMDMHFETDPFESFRKYQARLIREYNRLATEYGFVTVNATLGVDQIQTRIRKTIEPILRQPHLPIAEPASA